MKKLEENLKALKSTLKTVQYFPEIRMQIEKEIEKLEKEIKAKAEECPVQLAKLEKELKAKAAKYNGILKHSQKEIERVEREAALYKRSLELKIEEALREYREVEAKINKIKQNSRKEEVNPFEEMLNALFEGVNETPKQNQELSEFEKMIQSVIQGAQDKGIRVKEVNFEDLFQDITGLDTQEVNKRKEDLSKAKQHFMNVIFGQGQA